MNIDANNKVDDEVNILQLSIHGVLIGYLAGFKNGRNVLSIADSFKNNPDRPTFSLPKKERKIRKSTSVFTGE